MKSSGIGGQAVIEGVMMKNQDQYAVAVRTPEGNIVIDKQEYKSISEKYKFLKLPLLRGVVAFAESMSIGMKTLTYSARFYDEEPSEKKNKEKKPSVWRSRLEALLSGLMVLLAAVIAIGLFMVLPWFLTEQLSNFIQDTMVQALVEGAIRMAIFIIYVFGISLMKDIRRVYMYHGAEHKTINCIERGLDLTVDNVKHQSKEHRRCGTSFMLYVMVISILLFMFIRVDEPWLRIVLRIVLIPVVAGISYEWIRFSGKHDFLLVRILSRPGMWLQGLTTKEPDDSMIEVAIRSVEAVFDWKPYVEMVREEKDRKTFLRKHKKNRKTDKKTEYVAATNKQSAGEEAVPHKVAVVKKADHTVRRTAYFRDKTETTETKDTEDTPVLIERAPVHKVAALKKAKGVRRPMQPIEEIRRDSILADSEEADSDDEVLNALDKFFQ